MQTFITSFDLKQSAKALDRLRLNKQRVEAKQIYQTLSENKKAWSHHPAVLMYKKYLPFLAYYGKTICEEWISRGYKDNQLPFFMSKPMDQTPPIWLNDDFIISHRSNLLRKDFAFYSKFWPDLRSDLPYVWPEKI